MNEKPIFDEQALLEDVIKVWGKYGAHADMVSWMVGEITELRMKLEEVRKIVCE